MSTSDKFQDGIRHAAIEMLYKALDLLGFSGKEAERTKWVLEREHAVTTLRAFCEEYGDNDWEHDLYLADIIDKHLRKHIEYKGILSDQRIQNIRARMLGQDNRATAHPIYVVQQKRRYYGLDTDYLEDDKIVWMYEGGEVSEDDPDCQEAMKYYDDYCREMDGWIRSGFMDVWEFVQPFFSEKAADEYLKANKHNLNEPRVYVDSAYRNKEWISMRAVILGHNKDN